MTSVLVEPPAGGEGLCVLLLQAEGGGRREVGCQWEGPQRREVACQSDPAPLSDPAPRRDAAVQVNLLEHLPHSASPAVLCFSVRPDGPEGGALLQHCSPAPSHSPAPSPSPPAPSPSPPAPSPSPPAPTRTRTRTIRPAVRLSPEPRPQRRAPPPSPSQSPAPSLSPAPQTPPPRRCRRRRQHESPDCDVMEGEESGDAGATQADGAAGGSVSSQDSPVQVKQECDRAVVCDVCGKVMKNKWSLARHSFIHTGNKPFSCHLCELRFNRRDNLRHHLRRLHPGGAARRAPRPPAGAWLCAACGKTFNCRSRLKAHEAVHSGVKPHGCDLCPKAYMRTNDLEHHRRSAHGGPGGAGAAGPRRPRSLLCHFCGKEFRCRSQLAAHVQMHTGERPHLCDACGRKFTRKYQLTRHKALVHASGAEEAAAPRLPFACSVCGKRLKTEALLAAHAHVHADDKPHRCGVCLRGFQRATCLKQHHLRVHLKVKVKVAPLRNRKCPAAAAQLKEFPCPVCCKVFKFRSLLSSHSLTHSEARPFPCDLCARAFRRLSHLKRHAEVVHAGGARPPQSFVCRICGKDKKCRSQLERHAIIHTGERPFACDLCAARFNRRGNLQQHRKRMHGAAPQEAPPPPILMDHDMMYKQEETVVAVDAAAPTFDLTLMDRAEAELLAS